MPAPRPSNACPVDAVRKMSEGGTAPDTLDYLDASDKEALRLSLTPYDHMYASNTEEVAAGAEPGCAPNAESEVRFLREWLLLHLDLIQQQNDELLAKEKTILFLKQENEMLKERLNGKEKGSSSPSTLPNNHLPYAEEDPVADEMTQESSHVEDDRKDAVYLQEFLLPPDNTSEPNSADEQLPETEETEEEIAVSSQPKEDVIESPPELTVEERAPSPVIKEETVSCTESQTEKLDNSEFNHLDCFNETINESLDNSINNSNNFIVDSPLEDTLKNLRMSIKRKRVESTSSVVSLSENSIDDSRKQRKRKRWLKDTKIMTCDDEYVTQVGEINLVEQERICDVASASNLEVPRWRVKVYTSCYTMEGTENLDDDVYNKRHLRLENDERRRKRWDVQRIREQRMIEKLKQRQERVGSGTRGDENTEPVDSLWPSIEDIKYLEVTDQLPVSAFGCPVPRLAPSDFSLPWISNPHLLARKSANRKTNRRKVTKR